MNKRYFLIIMVFTCSLLYAGEADVLKVKFSNNNNGSYTFHVTVRHADTGWKHYANKWDVLDMKGKILGTRVLYHPHVDEQPFTRSLNNVKIPSGTKKVMVRAHDSVHKYGGKTVTVSLK